MKRSRRAMGVWMATVVVAPLLAVQLFVLPPPLTAAGERTALASHFVTADPPLSPLIATYAGGPGVGLAATVAQNPVGLARRGSYLYVADQDGYVVRRIDLTTGAEDVIAGVGVQGDPYGDVGDGGPATKASLLDPSAVAVDGSGTLYIGDGGRVRAVDSSGTISTYSPSDYSLGDALAVDGVGNLYVADRDQNLVYRIDASHALTVVAGMVGVGAYAGDGGPAVAARLNEPGALAIDPLGRLLIGDVANNRVRRVDAAGIITTVAGNGSAGQTGDGGLATSAAVGGPSALGVDGAGNLVVGTRDGGPHSVRRVDTNGVITTIAGAAGCSWGDSGPAMAICTDPAAFAVDPDGTVYEAEGSRWLFGTHEPGTELVRGIVGGASSVIAGRRDNYSFSGDGGPATSARLNDPEGLAVAADGSLIVADGSNYRVRKVDANGTVTTVAGNGIMGTSGDGGPATAAALTPGDVAVDGDGNVFIADHGDTTTPYPGNADDRVRRVDTNGIITTIAHLPSPDGLAVDGAGNVYVSTGYTQVKRIDTVGAVTIVAGSGTLGFSGDGGPATAARLKYPSGLAVETGGGLLIADTNNARVREVTPAGVISTVAGGGAGLGDGGPATDASLDVPHSVAVDGSGRFFVSEYDGFRVRAVGTDGIITTFAGTGEPGFSGDGGPATAARLGYPNGVATDGAGRVFIAQAESNRVRVVAPPVVPGPPQLVHARGQVGAAAVSWAPPITDGGSAVLSYTVTASPGGATATVPAAPTTTVIGGLINGTAYTFTVVAHNAVGDGAPSAPSAPVTPQGYYGPGFHGVTPFRALDSRTPTGGWSAPLGQDASRDLQIAGVGAVPAGATAVVMNVTVTGGTKASYLTVYPSGDPKPLAANLLFAPGQTVPNLAVAKIGLAGKVAFYNQLGSVHIVADVVGYYDDGTASGDSFTGVTPTRVLDSRTTTGGWNTPLGQGDTRTLAVTGVAGVPSDATGVVMNVTVTSGTKASYLRVWPAGAPQPITANLLFGAGQTVPNLVVSKIGADGRVAFFNQLGSTHVVADVVGYYSDSITGGWFHPFSPTRIVDDRTGVGGYTTPWPQNASRAVPVAGVLGIPGDAKAIVANVTATEGTSASYLTVYPTGGPPPNAANVLLAKGQTIPNLTMVKLGTDGKVAIYNQLGSVSIIMDVAGYYTGA